MSCPGLQPVINELWALIALLIVLFAVMRLWLNKHVVQVSKVINSC